MSGRRPGARCWSGTRWAATPPWPTRSTTPARWRRSSWPARDARHPATDESLAYWDALAEGLERGGIDGFMEAYEDSLETDPAWTETALRITRERMPRHRHPEALARALREVPRSLPFEGLEELETLDVPALVVASYDEADPGHPYAIAEAWAEALPRARLVSEEPGKVAPGLAGGPALPRDRGLPGRAAGR